MRFEVDAAPPVADRAAYLDAVEGEARMRRDGRPIGQWPRLEAGHSDDLGTRAETLP